MKKLLPIVLLLCFALTLASCAGHTPQPQETAAPTETEETAAPDTALPEETDAPQTALPEETDAPQTAEMPEETETEAGEPATIALVWADDWEDDVALLTACSVDTDPQTAFVICADNTVTDFTVLTFTDPQIDDEGRVSFTKEDAYAHGTLLPEAPLLVRATFYGDLPNIGIRYTDADGTVKEYAVDISGMDGSLHLTEIETGGAA